MARPFVDLGKSVGPARGVETLPKDPATLSVAISDDAQISAVPDDVRSFCQDKGIGGYLERAVSLAMDILPLRGISVAYEICQDPDTDDAWITLLVPVRGNVQEVLAAKKTYSAEWVANVPWPQRNLIRLSLDLA